jgi:iron complex transport system permease protein
MKNLSFRQIYLILALVLVAVIFASMSIGAIHFAPIQVLDFSAYGLGFKSNFTGTDLDKNIFLQLRLPRVLLCGLTGAILSVSGTLMQGLFRNPIVEPGLAGTSAGAALGAAVVFVFGKETIFSFTETLGPLALPFMAFVGSFAATLLVYRIASTFGKVNIFILLLAGIAINAICNAGTGFLSYMARDPQARSITFWNLGTFTTADWRGTLIVGFFFIICFIMAMRHTKSLNALMLGEEEAQYLGTNTKQLTLKLIVINTLMVAVATAMVGVIAFVGLIVPHLLRLMRSSDYRFLIPASALLGAILMELVDITARIIIPPAELPIGIITAIVGAPIFIFILVKQQRTT